MDPLMGERDTPCRNHIRPDQLCKKNSELTRPREMWPRKKGHVHGSSKYPHEEGLTLLW